MKTKAFIPGLIMLLISCSGVSQKIIVNGQESNGKLKWSDFTGKVERNSPFLAYTGYSINPKVSNIKMIGDSVSIGEFEITLELDPRKSWAKQGQVSDELLIHEQGHFNLGILCMREILEVYRNTKFTKANLNSLLQSIITDASKKYNEMGIKYDKETEHSKNKEQQSKWNEFFLQKLSL